MSAPLLDAGYLPIATLRPLLLPDGAEAETQWDGKLQALGLGVATQFGRETNRTLQRSVAGVYETPADCTSVVVPGYPVESVTEVALVYDGTTTVLTDEIRNIFARTGVVEFGRRLGTHLELLRVIFTGGYWLDDGGAMPADATPLPGDLLSAWLEQMHATIKAKRTFWDSAMGDPDEETGGGAAELALTPNVRRILTTYLRFT